MALSLVCLGAAGSMSGKNKPAAPGYWTPMFPPKFPVRNFTFFHPCCPSPTILPTFLNQHFILCPSLQLLESFLKARAITHFPNPGPHPILPDKGRPQQAEVPLGTAKHSQKWDSRYRQHQAAAPQLPADRFLPQSALQVPKSWAAAPRVLNPSPSTGSKGTQVPQILKNAFERRRCPITNRQGAAILPWGLGKAGNRHKTQLLQQVNALITLLSAQFFPSPNCFTHTGADLTDWDWQMSLFHRNVLLHHS